MLNQNVTAWRSAPAAVTVERTVLRWVAEAIGCEGFTGSLVGGGSSANLMGLAMAREAKVPGNEDGARPCAVYASAEVHMSVPKALAVLGTRPRQPAAHPRGRCVSHAHRRAGDRHRTGPPGRDPGDRDCRDRGHDEHRRCRSATRDRRHRAGLGPVAACRRRLRRPGGDGCSRALHRSGAGRLDLPGRPQMAVPAAGLQRAAVPRPGRRAPRLRLHRRLRQEPVRRPGRGLRVLRGVP